MLWITLMRQQLWKVHNLVFTQKSSWWIYIVFSSSIQWRITILTNPKYFSFFKLEIWQNSQVSEYLCSITFPSLVYIRLDPGKYSTLSSSSSICRGGKLWVHITELISNWQLQLFFNSLEFSFFLVTLSSLFYNNLTWKWHSFWKVQTPSGGLYTANQQLY